ncbi:STAS domain-containing protein [Motilibacter deserti]|uniref:Anti-sigma factor antagonist n=1 Tax=Motilibacter deserti TaxID=2714956 RepID=A0ABX0GXP2_9ACTN|nr:STAS domain-containing protein [Motilibacter deserti]NHC14544.1 STAS domain-containing protein [Motilibacter deserti]
MSLTLSSRRTGGATVVKLAGELDAASAVQLRMFVLDQIAKRHHVVVLDLADVSFVDSAGCRALVDARQRLCERTGQLRLARPTRDVSRMLRTTGLGRVLPAHATIAAALRAGTPDAGS